MKCDSARFRFSLGKLSFPWLGRCRDIRSLNKLPTLSCLQIDPLDVHGHQGKEYFPPLFLALLAQGRATHQGGCITSDSFLIEEMNDFLGQNEENGLAAHRYMTSLRPFRKIMHVQGTLVSLAGISCYNYYHWMLEILPRLHLFQTYANLPPDARYYAEVHKSFQKETLSLLGLRPEQLINSREQQNVQADLLWAASLPKISGNPHPWAVFWLRNQFLKLETPASDPAIPCLIISRRMAKTRAILNEEEMIARLQWLNPHVVCLETLSFPEQVALFRRAKMIIAPHGAGLTNLTFASPDCVLIELFSKGYHNLCFARIATILGCRYYPLLEQREVRQNMIVDLDALTLTVTVAHKAAAA